MGAYGSPDLSGNNTVMPKAYCRHCGTALYDNVKKCSNCNKKQYKSRWYLWLIIILLILSRCSTSDVTNTYTTNDINSTTQTASKMQMSEEEFKSKCEFVAYKDIARNPSNYKGNYIKFKGKVSQASESGKNVTFLIQVTENQYGFWDDTVYGSYKYATNESKILEDDIVTIYGVCKGDVTYRSVLGASITVPAIDIMYWQLEK